MDTEAKIQELVQKRGLNEIETQLLRELVVNHMAEAYPELETHRVLVEKVIRNEEERFLDTLARGLLLFEEEAARLHERKERIFPGAIAFRL